MLRLLPLLLLAVLSLPTPAAATTLDDALAEIFATDDAGLRLLRDNGASHFGVLTLERLPSASYVVEIGVEIEGVTARYPLKLGREDGAWTLQWQPAAVYASALLAMMKNDVLPHVVTTSKWANVARLPALPVIATRKRYVTPFGEVALDDRGDTATQGDLELSPALVQAGQSWVRRVLDDDPAPAGIDLLLDPSVSWRVTNKVLYNMSTVGLYQVTIVMRDGGAMHVAAPARQANFVVALYPLADRFGVRVAGSDGPLPGDGCADQMTACITQPNELDAIITTSELIAPLMFAASAEVAAGDVLRFANHFETLTGLPPHRLLVGYVQR